MKIITRTVWILSIVSLFADIASEMLYPIVPVYLKEIGFSVILIGLLEGMAEFVVGLSKGYFGKQSDAKGVRLPFVRLGYFLSACSKPMMALFTNAWWIFFSRTTDRLGKGLRTAARDALLSSEATPATKGRVFGFHRSWDTVGAVTGPLLALAWLYFFPGDYRTLFFVAFIPGLISVGLLFAVKERRFVSREQKPGNFFSFLGYWKTAKPEYRRLVTGLLLFALFNSSDIFLLLITKQVTGSDQLTILAYVCYNLVFALASYPMGMLADSWGMKRLFASGLIFFALTYGGFAFATESWMVFLLFFFYGIYAAATEGVAKAWITNLSHDLETATAIGFYTSLQSICTLTASTMAGIIWATGGPSVVFGISAAVAVILALYFFFGFVKNSPTTV